MVQGGLGSHVPPFRMHAQRTPGIQPHRLPPCGLAGPAAVSVDRGVADGKKRRGLLFLGYYVAVQPNNTPLPLLYMRWTSLCVAAAAWDVARAISRAAK
jgi:hypothetical protein